MADYSFLSYPMPPHVRDALLTAVEIARHDEVLTITYSETHNDQQRGRYDLLLQGSPTSKRILQIPGHTIRSLELLGFIEQCAHVTFFLTPQAFDWADYQKKSSLCKLLTRASVHTRDIVLGATTTLTLVLLILRILEYAP
jgi:hypothetical protein